MKIFPRFVPVTLGAVVALIASCSPSPAGDGPSEESIRVAPGGDEGPSLYEQLLEIATIEEMVMVPMRDGIRLATHVYRPKDSSSMM
mgnify:CR=1 FL=1